MSAPHPDLAHIAASNYVRNLTDLRAGLEHELRSPLNAIVLNVALLEEMVRADGGGNAVVLLERLQAVSESTNRLREGVLSLLESTSLPDLEVREVVDVSEVLNDLVELVGAEARQRSCRLKIGSEPAKMKVRAAAPALRQALLNLLLNSLRASSPNGEIRLQLYSVGGIAHIDVADDGPGLAEGMDATSAFELGTSSWGRPGLGLFVSRQIIESCGGEIRHVDEGSGCTFRVELPVADT